MFVKNFPDKKCGGNREALRRAKAWRDAVVTSHPAMTRKEYCEIVQSNNTSGIAGVCRYAKGYRLKDGRVKQTWYWEANWPADAQGVTYARFSVNDFGEARAKALAVQARKNAMTDIEGVFWALEPRRGRKQKR